MWNFFHFICNETETLLFCKGHEWNLTTAKGNENSNWGRGVVASGPPCDAAGRYRASRHRASCCGVKVGARNDGFSPSPFSFTIALRTTEGSGEKSSRDNPEDRTSQLYIHLSHSHTHPLQKAVELILLSYKWRLEIPLLKPEKGGSRALREGYLQENAPLQMDAQAGTCRNWCYILHE